MTREQLLAIFTDNGLEAPVKGVVNQFLNAFNQEKANEIEIAKKAAKDEAEAKYKDYIRPEDHQKIVDELATEKGKGALAERKAKYEKANLNIQDEDILNIVESKLKDSKDFEKDLDAYVKAHPSFLNSKKDTKEESKVKEEAKQSPIRVTIGGTGSQNEDNSKAPNYSLGSAINAHYEEEK